MQLVLPTAQREVALRGCHDEVGHLGLDYMLELMCDRFFWPCMAVQAKEHIGKSHPCLAFKARQQNQKHLLKTLWPLIPWSWSILIIYAWNLGKAWEENVLVITDHFTRYAQAYVTRI